MVKTVARNAQYSETGFDGFEESIDPMACTDKHFRFKVPAEVLVYGKAHTGKYSARVDEEGLMLFERMLPCIIQPCKTFIRWEDNILVLEGTSPPFDVDIEVLSGEVTFTTLVYPGPVHMIPEPASGWVVRITVTDAEGCTQTGIYHPNTTP